MKLSKKLLSLLAVFGLVLSACGSDSKSDDKTVTIAVDTDSYVTYFEEAGKAFEEETGIKVEVEKIDSMTDYLDALPAQTSNAADMYMLAIDRIGNLAEQKLLTGLDLDLSEYMENAEVATTYNDSNYIIPLSAETTVLIRNIDIMPDAPKSIKEIGVDNFLSKNTDFYMGYGMISDTGGYIFGDDTSDLGIATPEAIKGAKNIKSLFESGNENWELMQDDSVGYQIMMEEFMAGNVGSIVNGPWALKEIEEAGINFAVSPVPSFDGTGKYQALSGMKGLGVNGYSDVKEEAIQFIEFINTGEYAQKWVDATGEVSPHSAVSYEEGSVASEIYKAVEQGYMMHTDPEMQFMWVPMADALKQIAAGADVEEALKAAEEAITLEIEAM